MGARGRGPKRRQSSAGTTLLALGKGPVKRTQLSAFDPDGKKDAVYIVREIKVERVFNGKSGPKEQWLVGWEGLDDNSETWESIKNLPGHEADIRAFRERKKVQDAEIEAKLAENKKRCWM
ncbi:hypothetical protein CYMTET_47046 [Cymbomonas tetramitiformis]|uniref:Chromo domain-containing protein n=1 Tax=Cymbomonas tetramitiformis TaxID=36881 RepID=A0AAE0EX05_9CHLO|nr:hypothetical protein CYMTET_47046 [Cymbomonas tetramitiformis]